MFIYSFLLIAISAWSPAGPLQAWANSSAHKSGKVAPCSNQYAALSPTSVDEALASTLNVLNKYLPIPYPDDRIDLAGPQRVLAKLAGPPERWWEKMADEIEGFTLSRELKNGKSQREVLKYVPKEYTYFFDFKQGGRFQVELVPQIRIAAEDGSQPLRATRINYDDMIGGEDGVVFPKLLRDKLQVLESNPKSELWITARTQDLKAVHRYLDKVRDPLKSRIRVIETPAQKKFLWAQDGSKPIEGDSSTLVQIDWNQADKPKRDEYEDATKGLESAGLAEVTRSVLPFEGGNVIVGKDHVFLGSDHFATGMRKIKFTRAEALAAYERQFGRPVIEVGVPARNSAKWNDTDLRQPFFHIDLSMAIGQDLTRSDRRDVIVLQSPFRMLEDVFGLKEIDSMNRVEFGNALASKTRAYLKKISRRKDKPITRQERRLVEAIAKGVDELLQEELDIRFLQQRFEAAGYPVKFVSGFNYLIRFNPTVKQSKKKLETFNYTNVIFSHDYVEVPELNIPDLDQSARRTYESLGYKVISACSPRASLPAAGGVRCMTETYR